MNAYIDVHLKCDHDGCTATTTIQVPLSVKSPYKFRLDMGQADMKGWNVSVDHYNNQNWPVDVMCPEHRVET